MWGFLAAAIDFAHAALMAAWVLGLPLLFWHRWPALTRAFAAYAIAFIVLNQLSLHWLGECFLTTLARFAFERGAGAGVVPSDEWFTVRLANAVFRLTPSHRAIKLLSEALILATAIGVAFTLRKHRERSDLTIGGRAERAAGSASTAHATSTKRT